MLSEGHGADLYDVARQSQIQEQLLAETGRNMNGAVIKFFYPAALGWVFLPLTGLPLLWAYVVWSLLGVGFLIGSIYLLRDQTAGPGPAVEVLVLAAMSFFPILECLLQGQSSLFFLFLLACFYVLARGNRDFAAGLILGAVFLKPQLPVLLLLGLFLQRKWRVVAGCLVSVLLLVVISVLTIGPTQLPGYLASASQLLEDPGIRVELMPNLRGTLHRLDFLAGPRPVRNDPVVGFDLALAHLFAGVCPRLAFQARPPGFCAPPHDCAVRPAGPAPVTPPLCLRSGFRGGPFSDFVCRNPG